MYEVPIFKQWTLNTSAALYACHLCPGSYPCPEEDSWGDSDGSTEV